MPTENGIKTHINGEYERLFGVPSNIYDLQKSFDVFGYVRSATTESNQKQNKQKREENEKKKFMNSK